VLLASRLSRYGSEVSKGIRMGKGVGWHLKMIHRNMYAVSVNVPTTKEFNLRFECILYATKYFPQSFPSPGVKFFPILPPICLNYKKVQAYGPKDDLPYVNNKQFSFL